MIKQLFVAALCLPLLASCGDSARNETASTGTIDTIQHHGNTLNLEIISEDDFKSSADLSIRPTAHTEEEVNLQRDSVFIQRYDSVYIIKLLNGTPLHVISYPNNSEDIEKFCKYAYIGRLTGSELLVFEAWYYESHDFIVVNRNTGEMTHTWGMPQLSANKTYLASCNLDMEAGFTPNGIQIFKNTDQGLQLLFSKELDAWGPDEVKWINDNILYLKQEVGESLPAGTPESYIRMVLPL